MTQHITENRLGNSNGNKRVLDVSGLDKAGGAKRQQGLGVCWRLLVVGSELEQLLQYDGDRLKGEQLLDAGKQLGIVANLDKVLCSVLWCSSAAAPANLQCVGALLLEIVELEFGARKRVGSSRLAARFLRRHGLRSIRGIVCGRLCSSGSTSTYGGVRCARFVTGRSSSSLSPVNLFFFRSIIGLPRQRKETYRELKQSRPPDCRWLLRLARLPGPALLGPVRGWAEAARGALVRRALEAEPRAATAATAALCGGPLIIARGSVAGRSVASITT